ncbi:MAG: hypothetical protein HC889_09670 [Synechococcaceae cyanobacterium SM1_2_3]|nr:hypothetical protein [Synechococcaceae cyanobacterium SM1_2_3]
MNALRPLSVSKRQGERMERKSWINQYPAARDLLLESATIIPFMGFIPISKDSDMTQASSEPRRYRSASVVDGAS